MVAIRLDETDRRLLDLLVDDGRLSVNELASRANVARATAYARLARLQREGVITGFGARVDPARLGLGITALILCNVEQNKWPNLRSAMLDLPGIDYVAATSGAFDIVLLIRVADVDSLRDVVLYRLHAMDGVKSTQTVFVLDEQRVGHFAP